MASLIYNSAIDDMAKGAIDFDTDTFKVLLVTSSYSPNKDTHTKRSDVTNEVSGTGYTAGGATSACTVTSFSVRPFNAAEVEAQWMLVRQQRNALLEASDWTQIEDYDLGADRAAWATYRQELRDITTQANPLDLNWPQSPA